jgi:hypothetical protein
VLEREGFLCPVPAPGESRYEFRHATIQAVASIGPHEMNLERARLYTGLARAHYSLIQPRQAREAFESALRHAGYSSPGGALGILIGIARHLLFAWLGNGAPRPEPACAKGRSALRPPLTATFAGRSASRAWLAAARTSA